ncbi:zinc-binding alcohol dehydrogenase family protein [Streptomyces sp. TS71-3]|uniref:zinc-binding alcohol dehydrogenase family protein n=1 Tax=Streptomyces sp. TS71-3 TaxID=2733862 RepID=UPI001B037766|nr:zinc-binding alcohol dehydrogenase family protein [Streptomyces sp. TS71-3]GHJ42474.1 NADPH:quinone reductase [Streptomyces sp. TS71-3]
MTSHSTAPDLPTTAHAIASLSAGPVDADTSFVPVDIALPAPGPHDLLVRVQAVSVNPVDTKVRSSFGPTEAPKVLGFDASGVVVATGSAVVAFSVGDEVYYAGSVGRSGANTDYHLVDERITGHKPASLDFAAAAAAPLTTITAWESLFERMALRRDSTGTLLVMAGAGGVGSMAIQLARQLTDVTVVATASRGESVAWAESLGAHHVVNHHHLRDELRKTVPGGVNHILSPFSKGNVQTYADLMSVHGQVVAIDEPPSLDILPLKSKSQTWHWELMFTRPLFDPESTAQREILDEAARLFDAGILKSTLTKKLTGITADTLREAHRAVEGSGMIGKVVIAAE